MRPRFHILSVGLAIQSPVSHDRSISATSLSPKQLQEENHGILFPLEMVDQNLPRRPDPAPAARQACFAKQIRFDRQRIEASHVSGAVGSLDVKLVALGDHGEMIACESEGVQRVF